MTIECERLYEEMLGEHVYGVDNSTEGAVSYTEQWDDGTTKVIMSYSAGGAVNVSILQLFYYISEGGK